MDQIIINGQNLDAEHPFAIKAVEFLDLFRPITQCYYRIDSDSNIPIAAGLASSASGFAALTKALNQFHQWCLPELSLSIIARLGSGSACRSLWPGFVAWQQGEREDGMDSHGVPLTETWPELRIGIAIISKQKKPVSSREAMNRTTETSPLYSAWPTKVAQDLSAIRQAIANKDFPWLGHIAESNALAMHATMMSAWPPVLYWQPETISQMQRVWQLRQQGLEIYFTQDAGPNLKLLFLDRDEAIINDAFPELDTIQLF